MVSRCANGHVGVVVARGGRVVTSCPECLNGVFNAVANRRFTIGNYISRFEMDREPPKLSPRDASIAEELILIAQSRSGVRGNDGVVSSLRALVRDCAKANNVRSQEVMSWSLEKLKDSLPAMAVPNQVSVVGNSL